MHLGSGTSPDRPGMDDVLVRQLTPAVIGVLTRRGLDFATAEDAVQEALIQATTSWPTRMPSDPKGWLVTVAWRKFLDGHRADEARRTRELRTWAEPPPGDTENVDDTLQLLFLCAHPSLTPSAAVALTLRAVGGLTTEQIADAYLVPEKTMGQRISRAKKTVGHVRFTENGDLSTVRRVLYLIFNEGYTGDVDLAAEAIRLTRQLATSTSDEETSGLLALMLLHHARRSARTRPDGSVVPLAEQDRSQWDTTLIAEGVDILQAALARDRLGEFQAHAAIAALHADARSVDETDWVQIVSWYDELLAITASPVVQLNRAIAVGEADGAASGLAALGAVDPSVPRFAAASAYLHEKAGDLVSAARLYGEAAQAASNLAERHHLSVQAARLSKVLRESE
ncbi:RNA polymerase subunit sigma-24 [Rhodococcus sp. 06-156-3C]|nr:RNA polymerase subunit sigma-24 [Rhodococcus sp. 06-156-3C]OZD13534.1 RNA polymerase subunit sigma-24 [Rhodococcus sp. 06-156-4a]OZD22125.1 RNA polymerase subunit sigma-24 [Rhodococcus sp. 06-156-4C]OZD30159.1 RNA polymerase subunit sigma-24 [Rhodococcus sp. 06-156-3]OZD37565.1 RNA polymerase subunit sigma-24 [Rhodococcus sp. 06-156-3b]OZF70847.1 RNA polymerase subunit sigma-24 [Rhodococcus sp. 06-156-4]